MPVTPVTITNSSTAKHFSEVYRLDFLKSADEIAHQMIAVHPRIVARLRAEGLDAGSRIPLRAGSAQKAASAIILPGQKATDALSNAAAAIKAFYLAWDQLYAQPVQAAIHLRQHSQTQMMGL